MRTSERASPSSKTSERVPFLQGILNWRPATDGRVVLLAVVAIYFAVVALARTVWRFDLWPILGVPSGPSLFFDARNLTAAWECSRGGYDPLYENPCDPWGRPLMYLRPWLVFAPLGLDQSHTFALGVMLIGAVFVVFSLLVGRVPLGTGLILALAACSPSVMFALERGNMDVALFLLVTLAVLLWRTFPVPARVVSPILVVLAASAKLYPVVALPAFVLTRSRLASRTAVACLVVFALVAAIVVTAAVLAGFYLVLLQQPFFMWLMVAIAAVVYRSIGSLQIIMINNRRLPAEFKVSRLNTFILWFSFVTGLLSVSYWAYYSWGDIMKRLAG